MSDNELYDPPDEEDQLAGVYDLVEYKITKQLDRHTSGSPDWHALFNILELYMDGIINVKWTDNDMLISMQDGSEIDPEILFSSPEECEEEDEEE